MAGRRLAWPLRIKKTVAQNVQRSALPIMNAPGGNSVIHDSIISKGEDTRKIKEAMSVLLEKDWFVDVDEPEIKKTYHFKTYTKVADLHNLIAVRCKSENHHPTMITKYGSLTVHWTTHHPRGLSNKDVRMAQYCDEQAASIGTVKSDDAVKCKPEGST
ncbi:transcriptional coactivator/pterin dehydratase [Microthyrium microscopicum]|uniref:4a-hydroxytetrahydrobiopterin dehydratase n=1 Tax=Microthyrium microscopicum TaxID=703497 RepID=A0A6A6UHF5_9PEZI|nr:transcriptional coactivator/pterin dehydratase [Microthyrium microscopicum]